MTNFNRWDGAVEPAVLGPPGLGPRREVERHRLGPVLLPVKVQ